MSSSRKKGRRDPQVRKEILTGPHQDSGDDSRTQRRRKITPFVTDNDRETQKIWLNIFDKLPPQDKVTFLTTFPEWHDLVAPKRTLFLFHEIAPMLLETLPKTVSLQCRKICRQWTQDLDKQHQSHPDQLRLSFEKVRVLDGPRVPKYINRFVDDYEVRRFMKENESRPGNPFPGRAIYLKQEQVPGRIFEAGYYDLFHAYWRKVDEMLSKFRNHVHFATIHCYKRRYEEYLLESLEQVRHYLFSLSHLKRLKFVGTSEEGTLEEMRKFLDNEYRPQLTDLETVELRGISFSLANAILNTWAVPTKIKRLSFEISEGYFDFDEDVPYLDDVLKKCTNLEALELTNVEIGAYDGTSFGKLTHLSLEFCRNDIPVMPTGTVFCSLESFGRTLTHLKIKSSVSYDSVRSKIKLPFLQRLHMAEWNGNFDPLLQLRSLTFLRIDKCFQRKKDKKYKSAIEIYGFEKRMYESNIWNVMPNLKTIIIRKKMYDRHNYEKP